MTGKKLAPYSTHHGSFASGLRRFFITTTSNSQMAPVATVSSKRIRAKFKLGILFRIDPQHGQEGLLRDLDAADLLHALLAGLLFFQ